MEYYPLKVIKKRLEANQAYSFYFSVPEKHKANFLWKTAQFLSFRFTINGKTFVRSYSIASSPFVEGDSLRTTVGKVEGGVVSNHILSNIKEGDIVESQKPAGEFFYLPKSLSPKSYVLFSAGIGITPLFSILKTVLELNIAKNVLLVFSIRSMDHFIYQKELREWEKKFKDKLSIRLVISQEEGRLDEKKLSQVLEKAAPSNTFFYLCGPKNYMDFISKSLLKSGVEKGQIRTEDFKVTPILGPKPDSESVFFTAPVFEEGEPRLLKATLNGEEIEIPLTREKSLLEQLIDKGYNPPFSCTSGSCMSCMAQLKEGKIFQLDEAVLDEENIKNLECLSCQCYPLSKTVKIDYDHL